MSKPLTEAQEVAAKELAAAITEAMHKEVQQMAETLVGSDSPFGKTEFAVRDILLRVGAKAYEQYLAQKKTATKAPA
jgi:parvulin-like peptidyl-prolyl isomerase